MEIQQKRIYSENTVGHSFYGVADYFCYSMNILFKRADRLGLRYRLHWLFLLFRVILLSLAFVVHNAYIHHKMSWDNWVIPLMFIGGLLSLGSNKRKAIVSLSTRKLTVYGEWFNLKGLKYELPATRGEIRIAANQRLDYHRSGVRARLLVMMDIFAVLPDRTIELDSVQIEYRYTGEASREWEHFFDAVYNPAIAGKFSADWLYRFLQIGTWVVFFGSCIAAFYLAHSFSE